MTAVGNFLGCLMSFCIVGNVEAPPNENRTAPNPRKKFFIVGEECTGMIDHFRIHLFDTSKCGDRSESRRKMKHEISAFTFGCHLFIELIFMAYLHCWTRTQKPTRIRIPNSMVTLCDAEYVHIAQTQIRMPM